MGSNRFLDSLEVLLNPLNQIGFQREASARICTGTAFLLTPTVRVLPLSVTFFLLSPNETRFPLLCIYLMC